MGGGDHGGAGVRREVPSTGDVQPQAGPGRQQCMLTVLCSRRLYVAVEYDIQIHDTQMTDHVVVNCPSLNTHVCVLCPQGAELFLGNAGTAMRPLTAAVAAAGRGNFVLDGVARMRERPIQDLVDGLVQLGVDAKCTLGTGCPPVEVNAQGLPSGRVSRLNGAVICNCCCEEATTCLCAACAARRRAKTLTVLVFCQLHKLLPAIISCSAV